MKQFFAPFLEAFEIIIVAVASIFIIYGFIAQPFLVQGASMEPNFSNGDYLLVDEITYKFKAPARGEVIVFKNPRNESEFYIKRVIGLPGEKVDIKNNKVFINGVELEEKYLPEGLKFNGDSSFNLNYDEYFVMGDNRPQSYDSRSWGPLKQNEIIGAARLRFLPLTKLKTFTNGNQ